MRKTALTAAVALAAAAGSANGAVLINEINSDSFNTPTTDYIEYVELFSTTGTTTDLSGLTLLLVNGNGEAVYGALDLDGQSTDANGYYVIGSNVVSGAQNTSLLGAGNVLQNGADAVALITGNAADFPNATVITNGIQAALQDAVVYGTNDAPDTGLLTALGELVQYDEGGASPASDEADLSLSRITNGLNDSPFLQSLRTPGAANVVPEPAALGLLGVAGLGLLARRRRA